MPARLGAVLYIAGGLAAAAPAPETPDAKLIAIKCVYSSLKSNPEVQSLAAYSIDGYRHAIEFTFRSKSGRVLTGDMMISGDKSEELGWSIVSFHNESTEDGFDELDFLAGAVPNLDSKCHLSPVGDNLIPGPQPRSDWQRIDLVN